MSERVLVDQEIFLGRIDEQLRFRSVLEDILNNSHTGLLQKHFSIASEWSHILLLYGAGGMGKTTLSKRFRDIASGLSPDRHYHHKFKIIWLDLEVLREQDRRLAVRDAITFEMILDHLYSAFCTSGFIREFIHFDQVRVHLSEVETHVDQMLSSHTEDAEDRFASLRKLGGEGLTFLVRKDLPEADAFFTQEEIVHAAEDILRVSSEGLGYLRSQAGEWLRRHLKADDHDLFTFPRENLARAFAQGVRAATRSRPLVIFLDTYEIIDKIDPWLRLIIAQSGPRAVWVLSGRDNLVESRRYGQSYFIGYQGEAPAGRLRTFPMSEFNQNDIITYFAEKMPIRPLTLEQATIVQHATYGIPLAVKTAAALSGHKELH